MLISGGCRSKEGRKIDGKNQINEKEVVSKVEMLADWVIPNLFRDLIYYAFVY
jgi:hypothetical protein